MCLICDHADTCMATICYHRQLHEKDVNQHCDEHTEFCIVAKAMVKCKAVELDGNM